MILLVVLRWWVIKDIQHKLNWNLREVNNRQDKFLLKLKLFNENLMICSIFFYIKFKYL